MLELRPATIGDLGAVDALLARSYPAQLKRDYPPSVLLTALPLIVRAQPDLLRCGTYYVVVEDTDILGAGGWTPDRSIPTKGHIRHLVSDHRHLRRGIARRIIAQCFATGRASGITEMECWSTFTAEAFYQASGFESLGPMDVPLRGGIAFPAVRMTCAL
ncbi:MAG: GNAT family N-acetyltransferase [Roseobacter sp.]